MFSCRKNAETVICVAGMAEINIWVVLFCVDMFGYNSHHTSHELLDALARSQTFRLILVPSELHHLHHITANFFKYGY